MDPLPMNLLKLYSEGFNFLIREITCDHPKYKEENSFKDNPDKSSEGETTRLANSAILLVDLIDFARLIETANSSIINL